MDTGTKYAPEVERMLFQIERRGGLEGTEIGRCKERHLMEEIGKELAILDNSAPDEDTKIHLWFTVKRGSIEDWHSYEDAVVYEEISSEEEYHKLWLEYYPEDIKFFEFCYIQHGSYIGIFLGERGFIESREPIHEDRAGYWENVTPILIWTLEQVKSAVQKVLSNEYAPFMEENLPYYYRTGTISRKELWAITPQRKDFDLAGWEDEILTDEEIAAFRKLVEAQKNFRDEDFFIEGMTSAQFFAYCRTGYEANRIAKCRDIADDIALYNSLADGRDDGLTKINPDSPDEFRRWMDGDLQVFNGHHPWEVMRGGNSTHVTFGIAHRRNAPEGAYYLYLAGLHRPGEVIRFFIALRQKGIMVRLEDMDALLARCLGTDKVGIVPQNVFPRYCEGMFPGEKVVDFMNIHIWDKEYAEIVSKAQWQELVFPKPKETSKS